MLRDCPALIYPPGSGGQASERTIMAKVAVAEELTGIDELEELWELKASEADSEDDDEDDDEDEEDDDEEDDEGDE
jgi:hypothetical protein